MGIAYIILGVFLVLFVGFAVSRRVISSTKEEPIKEGYFSLLEIKIRKQSQAEGEIQTSALAAENMFASLHGLLREEAHLQEHFSFEIVSDKKHGIRFFAVVPTSVVNYVKGQVYAQYPDAHISVVDDYYNDDLFKDRAFEVATLSLTKEDYYPIKSFRDLEADALSSITSVLSGVDDNESMMVQYLIKPLGDVWQEAGHIYVNNVRAGVGKTRNPTLLGTALRAIVGEVTGIAGGVATGWLKYSEAEAIAGGSREERIVLTPVEEVQITGIEEKLTRMGFEVEIRVISVAPEVPQAESRLRLLLASFQQFNTASLNAFKSKIVVNKNAYLEKYKERSLERDNSFILNIEELASVFHFPTGSLETPNISWVYSRKTEPPSSLPTDNCVYIGNTVFRDQRTRFGILEGDDRLRHMYVIGKSGTGKSTLFESMISQDINNGHGIGLLDPHGETIEKVLERIPDNRVDDVIYFDPSDIEKPVGLNLMQIDDPSQKNLLASGLLSAIKQHFDFSWGPRLEYLLNYAILTLLDVPGTTMLGITRLMEDKNYQNFILHFVKDPVVRRFWETEFKEMKGNQKLVTEAIAPIQNKVNRFLASSTMRNILGQKRSTIDLSDAMNNGKILLINLSKGKVGADNANLLGALLVSRIQFHALQRANIPYEKRRPFYLYVDEFQNFATGSFEEVLSESRKYKLGLYLTHQFTAQLPEELLDAVYGNVGTIATFSLGAPDARALASEFQPYYTDEDIISLERFQIYIKLMIDGMTSIPFSAEILRPWETTQEIAKKTNNKERVLSISRNKYGSDRSYVEDKLGKWIETPFDKGMAIALENKMKKMNNTSSGDDQNI